MWGPYEASGCSSACWLARRSVCLGLSSWACEIAMKPNPAPGNLLTLSFYDVEHLIVLQ